MPPTIPSGVPLVAIVYAKLIDQGGMSRGVKPFIVHLSSDGHNLARGIKCKILTPRGEAFVYSISFS
jgi:acyl-CoA oxidase